MTRRAGMLSSTWLSLSLCALAAGVTVSLSTAGQQLARGDGPVFTVAVFNNTAFAGQAQTVLSLPEASLPPLLEGQSARLIGTVILPENSTQFRAEFSGSLRVWYVAAGGFPLWCTHGSRSVGGQDVA